MSENRTGSRSQQFKNQGKGVDDSRRKRADASLELRKSKKEDQLMKRRNVANIDAEEPVSPLSEKSQNVASPKTEPMSMQDIVLHVGSTDSTQRLHAVQSARRILSKERNPPIDDFIMAGLVPQFVKHLDSTTEQLQFEAAWALTNIASGNAEQTSTVVKAGAIPKFIKLLRGSEQVCEQSVWALGNIAGDGPTLRDQVIEAGAVEPLIALCQPGAKDVFLRNLAWTLSNLCRNKSPAPPFEACQKCLPTFRGLLTHTDKEILSDTCWALSYVTDSTNDKIQAVLDAGVLPRLVELLAHEDTLVVTPALRTLGNIVTGTDLQTQAVIETPGALAVFPSLLHHSKPSVKKEAAWAISNITAGNQQQIEAVIQANIIPNVIELMEKGDFKSQKEAVWVITNLTSGGTVQQSGYAVQAGVLTPLVNMMTVSDNKTIFCVLDALSNILIAATKYGAHDQVCLMIEELGGLDKLEALQEHDNNDIYRYANKLIEKYFQDDAGEDESLNPAVGEDQYRFSGPANQDTENGAQFEF